MHLVEHLTMTDYRMSAGALDDILVKQRRAKLTEADLEAHAKWKAAPWPVAPANHARTGSAAAPAVLAPAGASPAPRPKPASVPTKRRAPAIWSAYGR
jgi:hypothetical protein